MSDVVLIIHKREDRYEKIEIACVVKLETANGPVDEIKNANVGGWTATLDNGTKFTRAELLEWEKLAVGDRFVCDKETHELVPPHSKHCSRIAFRTSYRPRSYIGCTIHEYA